MRAEKVGGRHLIPEAELERATATEPSEGSLAGWLEEVHRLHDEVGVSDSGLPSGAELVRSERGSH